jgi:hypothetical protein
MGLIGDTPTDLRPSLANRTIPQKVTNVSIHDKGPEPSSRPESSGPMIEADAPSTEEATLAHRVGARPTGGSHGLTTDDPAQHGEGAM